MEEELTSTTVKIIVVLLILAIAFGIFLYQTGLINKLYSFILGSFGYFR